MATESLGSRVISASLGTSELELLPLSDKWECLTVWSVSIIIGIRRSVSELLPVDRKLPGRDRDNVDLLGGRAGA